MRNLQLLSWAASQIWAIDSTFADMAMQLLLHHGGLQAELPPASHGFTAKSEGGSGANTNTSGIAVIPMQGTIAHRIAQVEGASLPNGVSSERLGIWFDSAMVDAKIATIVLDINSAGGAVSGTPELAAKIYAARGKKRIIAIANSDAASAAYWIGSAASEFYVTPSGRVGSIGVLAVHQDFSAKMQAQGVKTTFIYAGENKVLGNGLEPLSEAAANSIQTQVNGLYDEFLATIAKHRGTSSEKVSQAYGKGAMLSSAEALLAGAVDGIISMDDLLGSLLQQKQTVGGASSNRSIQARHTQRQLQLQGLKAKIVLT